MRPIAAPPRLRGTGTDGAHPRDCAHDGAHYLELVASWGHLFRDTDCDGRQRRVLGSVAAGVLPGGLSLDAMSGDIHHHDSRALRRDRPGRRCRRRHEIRRTAARAERSRFAAAVGLRRHCGSRAAPQGPATGLGGAGFAFSDPVFGTRMQRVTDGTIRPSAPNGSYRTPSGTHSNAWSADGRLFYTVSTDGTIVPYAFDPATMRASRLPSANGDEGGLTLQFFNEPTFSYLTPGVAYAMYSGPGSNLHSVDQYDFQSGQYSQLLNLESLAGRPGRYLYRRPRCERRRRGTAVRLLRRTSQDRHFYLVVFDKPARRSGCCSIRLRQRSTGSRRTSRSISRSMRPQSTGAAGT